jgi:hypothetical protein
LTALRLSQLFSQLCASLEPILQGVTVAKLGGKLRRLFSEQKIISKYIAPTAIGTYNNDSNGVSINDTSHQ